jgi:FixJ family two-component response regulator/signal transduction histidine kinase
MPSVTERESTFGAGGAGSAQAAAREGAVSEGQAFEPLLADLSARCANVSHDGIIAEIEGALGRLAGSLGYDRCTYTEFAPDGMLHVMCSAARAGIEPLPRGPFGAGLPWLVGELRAGRMIALAELPDGLPPEAAAEAEYVKRIGLRSHLSVPLRVGGRVAGALSFAGLHGARSWPEEVITRLTIIGEVFASAVARVRLEKEAAQLRSRLWHADRVARAGALTAAIAHEINQPLAAILSNAQAGLRFLDRGGVRPEDLRAILEAIVRDDKRAAETIRTMRALLRRDATGRARIDLAATLREVLQLLAGELAGQGIRVETELGAGCWVMADKAQIEQVALNLVLNAAAAMQLHPAEERFLRVSVARNGDGRVVAAVCDSGPGIAAEHADAVFEPFRTTRTDGLGLGLAICRSIVQAHDGAIWVERNPDRGVTFRFELQGAAYEREFDDARVSPGTAASGHSAQTAAAGPAVCIVDDDAAVRESVVRLLAAAGWPAASYASASEFLERRPAAEVGCLLLDLWMPGMSGFELQTYLSGRGIAPPVVFLTGQADVATGVDAMKLGAVDFLVKPVESDVLIAAVRKALERHASEREHARERNASLARLRLLSAREREIAEHVIRGRLNKQIAADLEIAEQTVKQHRGRVMEKLEVRSVAELVRVCEASGLFALPGESREQPDALASRPRAAGPRLMKGIAPR